jgi:hypothetical protein
MRRNVPDAQGKTSFIRYTPGKQNGAGLKQRIIKMTKIVEDPLEPIAAAAIYKAQGSLAEGTKEAFRSGTEEGISKVLDNDRFELEQAKHGFEGAKDREVREGLVQFEKDSGGIFGFDKFLDEAKSGRKRGLDTTAYVFILRHQVAIVNNHQLQWWFKETAATR